MKVCLPRKVDTARWHSGIDANCMAQVLAFGTLIAPKLPGSQNDALKEN
jgi:hypothetical protein